MRSILSVSTERRLLILLLCASLLGFIGVVAVEAIPDSRIADNLVDAERAGLVGPSEPGPTPLGTTAARYTECTAFSVGLGDPPGENAVTAAMLGTAYTGCQRLRDALEEFDETGELRSGYSYLRYWHGHTLLTRPALAVTGVAGTRWLAFAFMAVAVGGMCAAVKRSFGTTAAALLAAPTMLTTDVVIGSLSTSSAIGTGSAWVAGWLSFHAVARRPDWRMAGLIAAVAGAITAYLDLMTTMPGSFALTVVGAALGASAGIHAARPGRWQVTGAAAIGWAAGLAWMWASKWIIASFAVGLDTVVDNVTSQIGFRLSGESEGVSDSRLRGLTDNLSEWWGQPLTPWVVVGMLATLAVAAIRWRRGRVDQAGVALCCALVAVPVIGWYVALNNHSQIHPLLVYRSLPIAFGAVVAFAYVASRRPTPDTADTFAGRADEVAAPGRSVDTDDTDDTDIPQDPGRDSEKIP